MADGTYYLGAVEITSYQGVRYIYLPYPVQGGDGVAVYPRSLKSPMMPVYH